jgi:hypothetical protein
MKKHRNNKNAGSSYERLIVNELKELGYDVVTSRAESRNMDNKKVDVFSPLGVENSFPYYVQCKISKNNPNYDEILKEMPKDRVPVIFHRKVSKATKNFMANGDYVILQKSDFYDIVNYIRDLRTKI